MLLKRHFETIITNSNPKKVPELLAENDIDVILLDMNYRLGYEDGKEGIYWFKEIKKIAPQVEIVLMTSYGNVETAVEGIKLGALDYILKPWDNDNLIELIKTSIKQSRRKAKTPKASKTSLYTSQAPAMQKVYTMANRLAKTDVNTLILGENGTGKYVLTQYIHEQSSRKDAPFVHVDLGSLNENLFESELFGYAKGAFTDAKEDTKGRFEMADGGTLFLDEIGNIPLHLQAKLLQVLQSKTVIRLGESKSRPVDVRILTATNTLLEEAIEQKLFREDLYYRINTVVLQLPPLRERQEDIPQFLHFFLEVNAQKHQRTTPTIDSNTLQDLCTYDWKGNIREMQNRVERAIILSDETEFTLSDFGISPTKINPASLDETSLQDIERVTIEKALEKHAGNISHTAEELGISRAALYRRIEKYQLNN